MKRSSLTLAAAAGLLALAGPALAAHDLPAGDNASPVPTPFPANAFTGTLLASNLSTITAPGGAFTGTFASAVYSNVATAADAANPGFTVGAPVLDFVYQFRNSAASLTAVTQLSMFDFAPGSNPNQFAILAWDQAEDFDGAGTLFTAGNQAAVDANRGVNGRSVFFNFSNGNAADRLDAGENSFALLLRVNATNYAAGFFSGIGGTTATASSFAPVGTVPAIPEPETYALMLAGLAAVGWVARRRRT